MAEETKSIDSNNNIEADADKAVTPPITMITWDKAATNSEKEVPPKCGGLIKNDATTFFIKQTIKHTANTPTEYHHSVD